MAAAAETTMLFTFSIPATPFPLLGTTSQSPHIIPNTHSNFWTPSPQTPTSDFRGLWKQQLSSFATVYIRLNFAYYKGQKRHISSLIGDQVETFFFFLMLIKYHLLVTLLKSHRWLGGRWRSDLKKEMGPSSCVWQLVWNTWRSVGDSGRSLHALHHTVFHNTARQPITYRVCNTSIPMTHQSKHRLQLLIKSRLHSATLHY